MSKIKIVGHASGSGVLTIAAPNTNTDRTITIPDVTGTLLDSGSDLPAANLTGTVADARISALTASKLTGALPAISAANLTAIPAANITGTLPAISGANLTSVHAVNGGRKNILINGAMNVAQRGTSLTGLYNGTNYLIDRFSFGGGATSAGRVTMTQDSDGPPGFANSLKLACTTADTSIAAADENYIIYRVEGQDLQQLKKGTSSAESMTLSFYVKGNAAATYTAEFYDADNSRHNGQTFNVTTSWNRVTMTYAPDTTGAYTNDNTIGVYIIFWIHAGSNNTSGTFTSNSWAAAVTANRVSASNTSFFDSTARTLNITGVQLEVGSVATNFEHRSYGEELHLCQRYYEIIAKPTAADDSPYFGIGHGVKTDQINWYYDFKAEKRAPFTLIVNTVTNGYYGKNHSSEFSKNTLGVTMGHQSLHSIMGYMTGISGVAEQSTWTMQCNGAGCLIAVDAEL
jgi:hypothetical protein